MLLGHSCACVVNSLFSSISYSLIGLFGFEEVSFLSSSYILDISPLSDVGMVNIASQSVVCRFVFI